MIDVQFESLTETPKTVLTEIQDFLGLRTRPLDSSLTPQNPRTLREMAANFDEIIDTLTGTKWEKSLMEAVDRPPQKL